MLSDSHAILLTPPGASAIAVVRLVGPLVATFVAKHFSRSVVHGKCVHGSLADGVEVLDDPVVALVPASDGVDINLHGGAWVVQSVLTLVERMGFKVAKAAGVPLAEDAVDADSRIEREMLRWLPAAKTELAIEMLLGQPVAWSELRERVAGGASAVAVHELAALTEDASLHHLLHPPRVAIVGVPNVGKSTLANALFAQERSITADLPGTTRDWVGEIANVDGLAVMLVDTPGIRSSEDAIESRAIERAGAEISTADLMVLVLDPTQPLEGGQTELIERFPAALRVVNKVDSTAIWDTNEAGGIRTTARTGSGVEALRRAIGYRFGIRGRAVHAPRWWTAEQRDALESAAGDRARFRGWIDQQIGALRTREL